MGEPFGAVSRVPSTNSGDFIFEMCSSKSCFHGAGGSTEAEGVVVDMVRKTRERRMLAIREAMIAVFDPTSIQSGGVCL